MLKDKDGYNWCPNKTDDPDIDLIMDCEWYAVKTNADRIRAMSDEELADWLARTQIDNIAEALKFAKIPYEQEDGLKDEVKKECLEWLKQPAEGGLT